MIWEIELNSKIPSMEYSKQSCHYTKNCMHMFEVVYVRSILIDLIALDRFLLIFSVEFFCLFDKNIHLYLAGNMWAQSWQERFDDLIPYPDSPLANITKILHDRKISIDKMYNVAEDFFTSIGLYSMTSKFWSRSMFKKPTDRDVVCHASASDFKYHNDFRVKICTEIDETYFYTIHHEMGHIEYYMAYEKHQPYLYQGGANSAFHEAIGDTIGMYASKFARFFEIRMIIFVILL